MKIKRTDEKCIRVLSGRFLLFPDAERRKCSMKTIFLEIFFPAGSFMEAGFFGRDEVEDPIHEALEETGLGEVTGGGSGNLGTNIDAEVSARRFDDALALISATLKEVGAPDAVEIIRHKPTRVVYTLEEAEK